jgi:hypothetical protein
MLSRNRFLRSGVPSILKANLNEIAQPGVKYSGNLQQHWRVLIPVRPHCGRWLNEALGNWGRCA